MDVLRGLLGIPTAPFREQRVVQWIESFAAGRGLHFRQDRWGNVWLSGGSATTGGGGWIFQAHLDHPGFVVVSSEGRRLRAEFRGSVSAEYFADSPVRLWPEDGPARGLAAKVARPKPESKSGVFPVYSLMLDEPAEVAPGTIGMWDLPAMRMRGTRLSSRACDDLVGTAGVICALVELVATKGADHVSVLLTRGEEAGFVGALAVCDSEQIDAEATLVSVETSREMPGARLGEGVVIRVGDRASVFDAAVTDHLSRTAMDLAKSDESFAWARQLMPGGVCESTVFCAHGLRAGALCLPLGNYHNMGRAGRIGAERIDLGDFTSLVKLLTTVGSERPDRDAPRPILSRLDELLRERIDYLDEAW
jgi:endoglucanase